MASIGLAVLGSRAGILIGGAAIAAAVGIAAWWTSVDGSDAVPVSAVGLITPETAPATVPVAKPAAPVAKPAAPVAQTAAPVAKPAAPVAKPAAPVVEPPSFDVVRIEADGAAQVAGLGAPGAQVLLLVDGAPVAEAAVARDGAFVALFTLAANPLASLLSLVMVMPDATRIPGLETVALAPIAGPVIAALVPEQAGVPEPFATPAVAPEPVAVPAAPAALLVTEQGVKVLQSPMSGAAATVSIDTISYTGDGQVQFAGRGAAEQLVRLYLNNAALAEVAVPVGGQWDLTKGDIAPGVYTLRADQLDSTGKVTSRFETPFKRETLPALAEAAASQPPATGAPTEVAASQPPATGTPTEVAAPVPEDVASAGPAPVFSPQPPGETPDLAEEPFPVTTIAPAAPEQPAQTAAGAVVVPASAAAPRRDGSSPAIAVQAADQTPAPVASPVTITVQPGLTLWAIAKANFGSGVLYVQVYEANKDKIGNPDLIYPGQVLTVPAEPQPAGP